MSVKQAKDTGFFNISSTNDNLSTDNFILRTTIAPIRQTINTNSLQGVYFNLPAPGIPIVVDGITYNNETEFVNTNNKAVIVSVSYSVSFYFNPTGQRYAQILCSAYPTIPFAFTQCTSSLSSNTGLSSSSTFVLPASATFSVLVYQDSGSPLDITTSSSIQIVVL